MKWTNKQYVDLMTYHHSERPMFSELFGPIVGLPEEWRAQGATEDMIAMHGFAFDYVPYYNLGNLDSIHRQKEIVLEDNDRYYVAIDHYGRRVRMDKGTSTIPLPENYPVETMDDWRKIKHMFEYDDCRISDEEIENIVLSVLKKCAGEEFKHPMPQETLSEKATCFPQDVSVSEHDNSTDELKAMLGDGGFSAIANTLASFGRT